MAGQCLRKLQLTLQGNQGRGQPLTSMNHFFSGWEASELLQSCRVGCDADGWMILPNKEPSYPHYFHALSPTEISAVKVTGDVEIGYIGFGGKGLHNHLESCHARPLFFQKRTNFVSSFRFAACPSSWVQLDLCLSRRRG